MGHWHDRRHHHPADVAEYLAVRPTSSVLKDVDLPADPSQVAEELGVDTALDGTYQRVGETHAGLGPAGGSPEPGCTLGGKYYDLSARDMLKFQDEIAQKVVDACGCRFPARNRPCLRRRSPAHPKLTTCTGRSGFTGSRYAPWIPRWRASIVVKEAEAAVKQDPSFANAYALLSTLYIMETSNFDVNAAANLARGEQEARRALGTARLSPKACSPWATLSLRAGTIQRHLRPCAGQQRLRPRTTSPGTSWATSAITLAYSMRENGPTRRSNELNPTTVRIYLDACPIPLVSRTR